MEETDLSLPGVLPLVIRRKHKTGYRYGQFYGPSWSSTFDERLELDAHGGAQWSRHDSAVFCYPTLPTTPDDNVNPLEGDLSHLALTTAEDGTPTYRITDPRTGITRHFPLNNHNPHRLWLTHLSDRNHNTITFHRTPDGSPTAVTHTGGYHVDVATTAGRISALAVRDTTTGDVTPVKSYAYDTTGNLTHITNSSGLPLVYTYDDQNRITSWTDRNNDTYRYLYDHEGRVFETVGPDGAMSSRFEYDMATGVTLYTDACGATTTYQHNELHQVIAETDPLGNTTHSTWTRDDRLLTRTNPLGHTTRLEWDDHRNLTAVHHPDGSTSRTTYNDLHLPTASTTPDGTTTHLAYDDCGNLTTVTGPDGAVTALTYDPTGAVTTVTDPAGAVQHSRNNPTGLPTQLTDPLGASTHLTRDAFGRPLTATDPLGHTTHLSWTLEGKLAARTAPDGTTESWTYDGEGNRLTHTDPNGGITTFEYTRFDQLAARTEPDGARYDFTYDPELRLTGVRNPQGLTWDYRYDPAGRLIAESDFDNRTNTYAHNPLGQLTTRTTPLGDQITFTYDTLGRPTAKNAAGETTAYTYDTAGHLTQATSPHSTLTRDYDTLGRVLTETVDNRTTHFTYDILGRRLSRTTPTGATTTYTHDAAGNRTTLTTDGHQLTFTHDELGRETTRTLGATSAGTDPVTLTHTWDPLGRLTEQSLNAGQSPLRHRAHTYRADGYLTTTTNHLTGETTTYELDAIGRPLTVTADNWSEAYAYDTAGNQTHADWPDRTPNRAARGNRTYVGTRIQSAGRIRYTHDAAGRTTVRRKTRLSHAPHIWRYTYNAEDQLTTCTTPDGTLWTYTYDPLGRRTAKHQWSQDRSAAVATTHFTWDGTRLAEQTDTTTGITLTWDHQGHRPLTQLERKPRTQGEYDSRFFAIITDLVGTPTELVDETGHIAAYARTTLWGTTTWNRDATAHTPLRFPGQYADPETGLHYNHHRHYDPDTARYTTPDPLGLTPAPNPLTYPHNPHTHTDPLGLAPCDVDALIDRIDENTYFHYTDEAGYNAITEGDRARFAANNQGKLFFTQDILSPAEVEMSIFLSNPHYQGKGDYLIAVQIPEGASLRPGEQPNEFIHAGGLKVPASGILFHGRNPFK
ncbi:DUF6531 domain-containing protein [Streptomyces sp. XM4193]|nr:DUF6531 domain-containing protein [Streptomyces sp. XM4193]